MKFLQVLDTDFNSIDFLKLCMAIIVVAIHTHPEVSINNIRVESLIKCFYSIAVPFFFVASGFLVWNKIWNANRDEKLRRLKKWISKTARLYVAWTIIYLPFTIYGFYIDDVGLIKGVMIFLKNFIFVGENFLSWPLWYLLGMLVASIMIYYMVKWNWTAKSMYLVGVLFAILCVMINLLSSEGYAESILNIYFKLFKSTRNGLFEGLPYILIGVLIAEKGVIGSKLILYISFVLSFILHMCGFSFAIFIVVYTVFSLVIQINIGQRSENSIFKNMRLTSTIVYFVHMIYVGLLSIFCPIKIEPVLLFSSVVLISFLTAWVVIRFKETSVVKLLFR